MKKTAVRPPPPTVPITGERDPVAWQGRLQRKPWHYMITAAIPCLNHAAETELVVELLRLQTCRPFIILVDTGSSRRELAKLESLRAADVELHLLRRNAMQHPCDSIASAMDLAFSIADTPYVFTTHQDCFLVARHFLQHLMDNIHGLAAIGYRLSPRKFSGWEQHLGHTATLFSLAEWDRLGCTWSLRRAASLLGVSRPANSLQVLDAIDTEAAFNARFLQAGAKTAFVGFEQNFVRTLDDNIDHCRSLVCTSLYDPNHHRTARLDAHDAMRAARDRIRRWSASGPCDPERC